MNIPSRIFKSLDGDSLQIGGKQTKPTVINLWFIRCGGCVAEILALNLLHKKYASKVNFIALADDDAKNVKKFLKKERSLILNMLFLTIGERKKQVFGHL